MEGAPGKIEQFNGDFEGVTTPEDFLSRVDFKRINELYDQLIERTGGKENVKNTGHEVDPSKISFKEKSEDIVGIDTSGAANVYSGEIVLLWNSLKPNEVPTLRSMKVLETLFHEATHVRGGYVDYEWTRGEAGSSSRVVGRTGYTGVQRVSAEMYIETGEMRMKTFGTSMNEAITEKIAHELFFEYLNRTGNITYLKDPNIQNNFQTEAYVMDRLLLEWVLQELAKSLSAPEDIVWKGFVHAYMSGKNDFLDLLFDIETALSEKIELKVLLWALSADEHIGKEDLTDVREISFKMAKSVGKAQAIDTIKSVINGLDIDKFKNVLGLR